MIDRNGQLERNFPCHLSRREDNRTLSRDPCQHPLESGIGLFSGRHSIVDKVPFGALDGGANGGLLIFRLGFERFERSTLL